jgi:antibiotic biosynthesis monooxygenase (ABM) superfamily enzyme
MTVSIVTQTSVRPERSEDFARWQGETSNLVSSFPGFVEQRLMPPNPPLQVDWVILQRFHAMEDAQRWLASPERQTRIEGAAPFLIGRDDVHIVRDDEGGRKPAPVSAVISTRIKPGKEIEYRAWERKIAAAQSKAPGLQGYRFEPPVPGVQDDYVAILRFDNQANLQAWLDSSVRKKLLEEAEPLTEEFHARMGTGFEQWFRDESGAPAPWPVWKMDMIVLLLLYPIVFLWGVWIGTPILQNQLNTPWAINLFVGNIFSVLLTGFMVPWVANHMGWWMNPKGNVLRAHLLGALLVCAIYAACIWIFWKFF